MNLLSKITLYACTILLTTQSYGMMAQLRLGLQKSSQSVGTNRSFSSTTFSEKMAKFFAGIGTKKDKGEKTAHPTSDTIIKRLLVYPYRFSDQEQKNLILQHPEIILKSIKPSHLLSRDWSADARKSLATLLFTKGDPQLLTTFLLDFPCIFSKEEQSEIVAQHPDALLDLLVNFNFPTKYLLLAPYTSQLVGNLLLQKGSPDLIVKWCLHEPGVFTEEQHEYIGNSYTPQITKAFKKNHLVHLQHYKKIYSDILIKNGSPDLIIDCMLYQPSFFSDKQQEHLLTIFTDVCSQKVKLSDLLLEGWGPQPTKLLHNLLLRQADIFIDTEHNAKGPLFSNYLLNNRDYAHQFIIASKHHNHFGKLLPSIFKYVHDEYKQDRIVLFHGQKATWMLLGQLYSALAYDTIPHNHLPLRFRKNSTLSEEQIEEIRSRGTTYNWRQDVEEKENLPIFTNLHLAANEADDNSWIYALSNQDYSGDTFFEPMVKKILKATDVCKDDSELTKHDPLIFFGLKRTFETVNKEFGDHGRLILISMDKKMAEKLVYSTGGRSQPKPLTINGKETISATEIAENIDKAPADHQFALIPSQEIINPHAAHKAGVKIVGFHPLTHPTVRKTKNYTLHEKKFNQIIGILKNTTGKKVV